LRDINVSPAGNLRGVKEEDRSSVNHHISEQR
jgi:hypothetical protein